jgi:hypothetical protein
MEMTKFVIGIDGKLKAGGGDIVLGENGII